MFRSLCLLIQNVDSNICCDYIMPHLSNTLKKMIELMVDIFRSGKIFGYRIGISDLPEREWRTKFMNSNLTRDEFSQFGHRGKRISIYETIKKFHFLYQSTFLNSTRFQPFCEIDWIKTVNDFRWLNKVIFIDSEAWKFKPSNLENQRRFINRITLLVASVTKCWISKVDIWAKWQLLREECLVLIRFCDK